MENQMVYVIVFIIIIILFLVVQFFNKDISLSNTKSSKMKSPIIVIIFNDPKKKSQNENVRNSLDYINQDDYYHILFYNNLFINTLFVMVNDDNVMQTLAYYYSIGCRYYVGLAGTEELFNSINFFINHPDTRLFNILSTVSINNKPSNIYRLQLSDDKILKYVLPKIQNTACVYDANHPWARILSKQLEKYGISIFPYSNGMIDPNVPKNMPIVIVAVGETENIIRLIPNDCPKLFGFDGSIFLVFTNESVSEKAIKMNFECVQGEPFYTPQIIYDLHQSSKIMPSADFMLMVDGIQYANLLDRGLSDTVIQKMYTGFTGPFVFNNGEAELGNIGWYQYVQNHQWIPTEKIIIQLDGSCTIYY